MKHKNKGKVYKMAVGRAVLRGSDTVTLVTGWRWSIKGGKILTCRILSDEDGQDEDCEN